MDITPSISPQDNVINGYGKGGFIINGETCMGPLIVTGSAHYQWSISDECTIDIDTVQSIIDIVNEPVEILLIGTGSASKQLAAEDIAEILKKHHVQIEIMTTEAACRTYNVLLSESRQVAVALIPLT